MLAMGRHSDDELKRSRKDSKDRDDDSRDDSSESHKKRKRRRKEEKDDRRHDKKRRKERKDEYSKKTRLSESFDDDRHKNHKKRRKEEKRRGGRTEEKLHDLSDERQYQFVDAIYNLFNEHPALSTELPIMLIRLASGASLDLSQMSDATAARGLEKVFETMMPFGLLRNNHSWSWKSPTQANNAKNTNSELLFVRIARTLLDQVGVTMDAVSNFGTSKFAGRSIKQEVLGLFDRFGKTQKDGSLLANTVSDLCDRIISGENTSLDEISNEPLRIALGIIFGSSGLEQLGDKDASLIRYVLPKESSRALSNLHTILQTCQQSQIPAIRGPLPESMADPVTRNYDSDDDNGPVPIGEARRPILSNEQIHTLAVQRKEDLDVLNPNYIKPQTGDREDWMMHPGEHEFLQGISATKTRNFLNKKVREQQQSAGPIMDPKVQAEVDAIYAALKESRGPSLMDLHKETVAAKAEESKKGGFGWKRDKDLDAGRRVDKEALKTILGGAGVELKDKFQGGYGR